MNITFVSTAPSLTIGSLTWSSIGASVTVNTADLKAYERANIEYEYSIGNLISTPKLLNGSISATEDNVSPTALGGDVRASVSNGTVVLSAPGIPSIQAGGSVAVQDEGVQVTSSASAINFRGAGVTATAGSGGTVNVDVPGSVQPLPVNARFVCEGDSLTDMENTGGANWQFYFGLFTGARLYRPQGSNQGVGGQKISALGGDSTYISHPDQIAAVRAQKPDLVTLMAGRNDIASGITDVTAIINAFKTCISGYLSSDVNFSGAKYVVVGKMPPRSPLLDVTWTASMESTRVRVNELIDLLPYWDNRVIVAQTNRDNVEGTWDLLNAGVTFGTDGIHPHWAGYRIIARAFTDVISPLLPQSFPSNGYLGADNLVTNPHLYGTGGTKNGSPGSTGEVADSWTVNNNMAGTTVVCSKTSLNGAFAQRIVASGTLTTAASQLSFFQTVTYNGQPGEGYEAMFDIEIAAGMSNIRSIYVSCDTATSPVSASTVPLPGDKVLSGTLRTKITAPLSAADTSSQVRLYITGKDAGVPLSLDIKISRPYFRKSTASAPI